jgi:hypothetical protein
VGINLITSVGISTDRRGRCKSIMLVLNHFHSVKNLLFSSAKPRDFDGMLDTGLPVSMYTTKSPIDKCRFNVTQHNFFFTFSVKDRYQLNYFICIKDFNAQIITSLKLNLFISLFTAVSIMKGKRPVLIYFCYQIVGCRKLVFTQPFSWHLHITITYILPHLRL